MLDLEIVDNDVEEMDAFNNYKYFESKLRAKQQDLLQFMTEWEKLYNECNAKGDITLSDRALAYKLIIACNLNDKNREIVFKEARISEIDGKVFDRTKAAIRMTYNNAKQKYETAVAAADDLVLDDNENKIRDLFKVKLC